MSTYRPEFEAALRLFTRVSEAMVARGLARPVLVGGAAVELTRPVPMSPAISIRHAVTVGVRGLTAPLWFYQTSRLCRNLLPK